MEEIRAPIENIKETILNFRLFSAISEENIQQNTIGYSFRLSLTLHDPLTITNGKTSHTVSGISISVHKAFTHTFELRYIFTEKVDNRKLYAILNSDECDISQLEEKINEVVNTPDLHDDFYLLS